MSPSDKPKGELHKLEEGAPPGLELLRAAAEGIIKEHYDLLGTGDPSTAPDPQKIFQTEAIKDPDHQSTMLNQYTEYMAIVGDVKEKYDTEDEDVFLATEGIGSAITDACGAMDGAVNELNVKIDNANDEIKVRTNSDGSETPYMPPNQVTIVFDGIWKALDATYNAVSGVSDQAARDARNIGGDDPPGMTPTNYGQPTAPYSNAAYSGVTPSGGLTPTSGSMGTAIIPSGDKPDAMAIMKYLVEEHGFTPAQAAGIVANAKFESDFKVGATGDSGTAHGLFQWRFDRHAGLQEFASRPGEDIGNWETHIDYMVHELKSGSSYQRAEDIVYGNPNDARAVAEGFDRHYERSSGHTINDRREYAAGILDEWNRSNSNIAV